MLELLTWMISRDYYDIKYKNKIKFTYQNTTAIQFWTGNCILLYYRGQRAAEKNRWCIVHPEEHRTLSNESLRVSITKQCGVYSGTGGEKYDGKLWLKIKRCAYENFSRRQFIDTLIRLGWWKKSLEVNENILCKKDLIV